MVHVLLARWSAHPGGGDPRHVETAEFITRFWVRFVISKWVHFVISKMGSFRNSTAIGGTEPGVFRPAWILSEHPSCLVAVFNCQGARLGLHQVNPSYNAILAIRDGSRAGLRVNAL